MKRLLAMLMALFLSMFENVDYEYQDAVPFAHDSYYTVQVPEQTVDYRDLYGKQIAAADSVSCVPTTYSVACENVIYSDGVTRVGAKWVEARVKKDISEIKDTTFTFESDTQIACPYSGTLMSSSKTGTGTVMEVAIALGGKNYRLFLEDMERWWCCEGKADYDNPEKETWVHTCNELKGTTFKSGTCLGRAKAGKTKLYVMEGDTKVDLNKFFSN